MTFKPAWWMKNPHAQTLFSTFFRRKQALSSRMERFELDDGDFVDLAWVGEGQGPIVLLLHGLGGSIDSPYAQGMVKAISDRGWRAVVMHFRGCSGAPNRLARCYHSGDTGDVSAVVQALKAREADTPLFVVGYSLGGNVLLKWLGETGADNPVTAAVAVSVPFQLQKAARRMQRGFSSIYQWHLVRELRKTTREKFLQMPPPPTINLDKIKKLRSFWQFDDQVTAPLHGFDGVNDYYQRASSRQFLPQIAKPTLIVHAKDDPFMKPDAIPLAAELSASTELQLCDTGGHVGFISGKLPGKPIYWLEQRIPQYFQQFLS